MNPKQNSMPINKHVCLLLCWLGQTVVPCSLSYSTLSIQDPLSPLWFLTSDVHWQYLVRLPAPSANLRCPLLSGLHKSDDTSHCAGNMTNKEQDYLWHLGGQDRWASGSVAMHLFCNALWECNKGMFCKLTDLNMCTVHITGNLSFSLTLSLPFSLCNGWWWVFCNSEWSKLIRAVKSLTPSVALFYVWRWEIVPDPE